MNCLETEKLFSYACRLTGETDAATVRAHLRECSRCREIVEQYQGVDGVLDEWKAAEPSSAFDARVREAVNTQRMPSRVWDFWGRGWKPGLALASLGFLILGAAVWLSHRQSLGPARSTVAAALPPVVGATRASARGARSHPTPAVPNSGARHVEATLALNAPGAAASDDTDKQTLDDYDLAASFDVLSELPKGEPRGAN